MDKSTLRRNSHEAEQRADTEPPPDCQDKGFRPLHPAARLGFPRFEVRSGVAVAAREQAQAQAVEPDEPGGVILVVRLGRIGLHRRDVKVPEDKQRQVFSRLVQHPGHP